MDGIGDLGTLSALLAGISLSAAAGLRVFLPVLALGLASRFGVLELGEPFAWLASDPVLLVAGIAALLEIGGYYIPLADNLLDTLATPAAIGGGTVIVASLLPEMNNLLQWGSAALLGGGAAGIVQGTTVAARSASTASTGGLGNPLIATSETGGSLIAIMLALLIPVVFGVLVIAALVWLAVRLVRVLRRRRARKAMHAGR
ncbi:3-deoxy-manno-octulosonate cytidylyltransferase [Thioalkalivibrio nitratireducens DSM 14787]|uniref:3-deoxy-manno-octulosonate cytidylyltransferase n=1 Tax=Thioalkalivibrio nitratireducens (strain DSM 14787 / UNIQEM 213 / ALEN2) TaxID=1255043 RepID=L0E0E3_THIND|nr:DUF4126 domain-containing protein [Thioalkalivibrio nitratireducens]AGA34717.1 3-deoxy-manno-octulosonate cytidylyltransferase [Thioalkalivibrio nitratireducens DSM 14787]